MEERRFRRRAFLADLLFAGGGLAVAALTGEPTQLADGPVEDGWDLPKDVEDRLKPEPEKPRPRPRPRPRPQPTRTPEIRGDVSYPGRIVQPQPKPRPRPEP